MGMYLFCGEIPEELAYTPELWRLILVHIERCQDKPADMGRAFVEQREIEQNKKQHSGVFSSFSGFLSWETNLNFRALEVGKFWYPETTILHPERLAEQMELVDEIVLPPMKVVVTHSRDLIQNMVLRYEDFADRIFSYEHAGNPGIEESRFYRLTEILDLFPEIEVNYLDSHYGREFGVIRDSEEDRR